MKKLSHHTKEVIALVMNIAIVILEVVGLSIAFTINKWYGFAYYTNLSNGLFTIGTIIYIAYLIRRFKNGKEIPHWAFLIKFIGLCHISITFFCIAFVITPISMVTQDTGLFHYIYPESFIFLHTLCPLLAGITFYLFEKKRYLEIKHPLYSLIFIILYVTIMVILILSTNLKPPYPFLNIKGQLGWLTALYGVGMFIISTLIIWLLYYLNNRLCRHGAAREKEYNANS